MKTRREVRRFDAIRIRGLEPFRNDADGSILFDAVVSEEGILEYTRADGSVHRELVTKQAILDTARTMPRRAVTLGHPADGFVDPDNADRHAVGDVDGEAMVEETAQGSFVRVKLAIRRRDAIDAIERDGVEQLSAGYVAVVDHTPGVHPVFGRYDAAQVGRVCNHTAIVPRGRAGETVALLRADAEDALTSFAAPASTPPTNTAEDRMHTSLILLLSALGVPEGRLDDEDTALDLGLKAARAMKTRLDEAEKAADEEHEDADTSELEKLRKDNENLKGQLDAMKEKMDEMKEKAQARADAAEKADLLNLAKHVKLDDAEKLDLPALRVAVAQKRVDSASADWSVDRLAGILDVIRMDAAESTEDRADSLPVGQSKRVARPEARNDAADDDGDEFFSPTLDNQDGDA